jgi:Mg2+ and Co2+ transporter CorA
MSAIVFDRNKVDHLEVISDRPRRLRGSMLLWIDVHDGSEYDANQVADELELDDQTRACLADPSERACFEDHGRYLHITTYAPREVARVGVRGRRELSGHSARSSDTCS